MVGWREVAVRDDKFVLVRRGSRSGARQRDHGSCEGKFEGKNVSPGRLREK